MKVHWAVPIIALLVLTVGVSSAFESAYADEDDPIKMVLDITYQNILELREDAETIPENADTFFAAGEEKYNEALAALEAGDTVAAKENALIAMALFENSAEEIGAIEDQALDAGIPTGQGLGGIPSGASNQFTAANIFDIQEEITGIVDEVDGLRELIESNGLDVDFEEYERSINLAKEVLANGDIPDAQAKLDLANQIKNKLYDQIDAGVKENQDERVKQFAENSIKDIESILEKGENLGLTKKVIDELQDTLDVLKSGDIDDIIEKTSDDSEFAKEVKGNDEISNEFDDGGDETPGDNGDETVQNFEDSEGEPGQTNEDSGDETPEEGGSSSGQTNEDSGDETPEEGGDETPEEGGDETPEGLPPGFGAAGNNPNDNAKDNGNGLGLGKIPPGLAKLFGYDDGTGDNSGFEAPEGLPPGFEAAIDSASETGLANGQGLGVGNIPPGQLKKLDYSEFGTYSPDDYFEDAIEDLREDSFEEKYDKMYKNSKAKEKKEKQNADRLLKEKGNTGGGNPNCDNEGVTDNDPTKMSGQVGVPYVVEDFTAVGSSCAVADPSQINIQVTTPPPQPFVENLNQGESFIPTTAETYTITASFQGQFETREVVVLAAPGGNNPPTADAGPDQTVTELDVVTLDGSGSFDPDVGDNLTYSWVKVSAPGGPNLFTGIPSSAISPSFTSLDVNSDTTYTFTLTVTDDLNAQSSDSVDITVTDGSGGGNTPPTIDSITADSPVNENTSGNSLSVSVTDPDVGDTITYTWTIKNGPISGDVTLNGANTATPTFDVGLINGGSSKNVTFEVEVSDGVNPSVTDTVTVTVNQI